MKMLVAGAAQNHGEFVQRPDWGQKRHRSKHAEERCRINSAEKAVFAVTPKEDIPYSCQDYASGVGLKKEETSVPSSC